MSHAQACRQGPSSLRTSRPPTPRPCGRHACGVEGSPLRTHLVTIVNKQGHAPRVKAMAIYTEYVNTAILWQISKSEKSLPHNILWMEAQVYPSPVLTLSQHWPTEQAEGTVSAHRSIPRPAESRRRPAQARLSRVLRQSATNHRTGTIKSSNCGTSNLDEQHVPGCPAQSGRVRAIRMQPGIHDAALFPILPRLRRGGGSPAA